VMSNQGGRAVGTDLGDLAQVGGKLLTDRTPLTGGGSRAALQNAGLFTLGGAGAAGGWAFPVETALLAGGSAGLNALLNSPRLGRSLLGSPQTHGLLNPMLARMPLGLLGSYHQSAPDMWANE
jgi:hypothetical protein